MLKLKYLFENYELAKECLKLYDHSEKHLDKMLSFFLISSNAIYPFYATDKGLTCFLRLSPVEEKNIADVASEIHFIQWLRENGVNAMKPYPMKNGKLFDVIETSWGTYNLSCFEEVDGDTLEDSEGDLKLAFGYGKALGELHNASIAYPYAEERRSYLELLDEIKQRLALYHAPDSLLHLYEETVPLLKKLKKDKETFGLVHYDFEPDNVLYDEDTDSFGIIDFDDSIRCWYALDVVRAIDAMGDVVDGDMVEEAIAAFLNGYRSVRPLSEEQEQSFPLMRKLVAMQEYATILYVLSEKTEDEPEWLLGIEEKLQNTMRKIEKTYHNLL